MIMKRWCVREDLNLHTRRALPPQGSVSTVPPLTHCGYIVKYYRNFKTEGYKKLWRDYIPHNLLESLRLTDEWVSVKSDKSNY